MSTNITGVVMSQPTAPQNISPGDSFTMGGQIVKSGGGGWAESGDMYFEWDQGIDSWTTILGSGDLSTQDTNPIAGLQTTNEQTITVDSDSEASGIFNIRVKLIEDDLTEHTSSPIQVTISSSEYKQKIITVVST